MARHGFPDEFQCGLAISLRGDVSLQHVAFVIDTTPEGSVKGTPPEPVEAPG